MHSVVFVKNEWFEAEIEFSKELQVQIDNILVFSGLMGYKVEVTCRNYPDITGSTIYCYFVQSSKRVFALLIEMNNGRKLSHIVLKKMPNSNLQNKNLIDTKGILEPVVELRRYLYEEFE